MVAHPLNQQYRQLVAEVSPPPLPFCPYLFFVVFGFERGYLLYEPAGRQAFPPVLVLLTLRLPLRVVQQ